MAIKDMSEEENIMKKLHLVLLVITLMLVPVSSLSRDWNPLSDSGQSTCYDREGAEISCPAAGQPLSGQDGQYQGTQPSYQDNGNQTVTDKRTGLVWIDSEEGIQRPWKEAVSYCDDLDFSGQTDWRLPTKIELESIVDYSRLFSAINQFMSCESSFYWTVTPHVTNPDYAWSVFCPDGADHWVHISNDYFVRCVRTQE